MEYKQDNIIRVLKERIADNTYGEFLPTAIDLAEEFQVNVKTVNKAMKRLVDQGIVERKRHSGTKIIRDNRDTKRKEYVIEVLFEGFSSIFTHPFWSEIWESMIQQFSANGYRTTMVMLKSNPETGLLDLDNISFYPASGRVVLGIREKRLLNMISQTGVPFITACDPLDKSIPQISFDFSTGIYDAVAWLWEKKCRDIAFIGQTQTLIVPQYMNKFNAYLQALQHFRQVDPRLIGGTRPLLGGGAVALHKILKQVTPDAIIAAYDHQIPEINKVLHKQGLDIPIVGCDGLNLSQISVPRPVVAAPRRRCGELIATKLIHAINVRRKPGSVILPAKFCFMTDNI